jgi:hypothetical protein
MLKVVCDECGKKSIGSIFLATGRVFVDGKDIGQSMDYCEKHEPGKRGQNQPLNCHRVKFVWPKSKKPKGVEV